MIRPSIVPAAALVALVACSGAGSAPRPIVPPDDAPGVELRVDATALTVHVRGDDGTPAAVARLTGAWLDVGDGGQWFPLTVWHVEDDAFVAEIEATPEHSIRVSAHVARDGDVVVRATDHIAVRAPLAGFGVGWQLLAESPIDEVSVPLLHPIAGAIAGDVAFRTPIAYVRSGARALAVEPDLESLRRARRLPGSLEVQRATQGALVVHAITAQRLEARLHDATTLRDPSRAVRVRDETVEIAHRLFVTAGAVPSRTLATRRARIWDAEMAPALARSATPFVTESWDSTTAQALEQRLARDLRTVAFGDRDAFALVDAGSTDIARFGARRNGLHDAVALARRADRLGDDQARETARRLARLALAAPRRGGMTPHGLRLGTQADDDRWLLGDPDGPYPDAFCAADAATTAGLLLELAELLPELRPAVFDAARVLARFLRTNQRPDGAVPAIYEAEHLTPVRVDEDALPGATAAIALFLTQFAEFADDADCRTAARAAIRFVSSAVLDRDAPIADPSLDHRVLRDPISGDTVRDLAPLAAIARAAALSAQRTTAFSPITQDLLGTLAGLQQVWSPPWLEGRGESAGGFGGSNADANWSAEAQALAAQAMFDGYAATGSRAWLERGAAAIRAGLVPPMPDRRPAAPAADELALATASTAVVERCRARFGQAVVDVAGGFVVGLDTVWFDNVEVSPQRIGLRALTHAPDVDRIDVRIVGDLPTAAIEVAQTPVPRVAPDRFVARVVREPVLEFRPPPALDVADPWLPRARFRGPTPAPGSVHVEAFRSGRRLARILLHARDDGTLVTLEADALRLTGLAEGEQLDTRLTYERAGRFVTVPAVGFRTMTIGAMTCIDPGDDLESTLVDATPDARVERFVDGRENARALPRGASFTHALPIPRDAAAVLVRVRAVGALSITEARGDRTLHTDSDAIAEGDRTIEFRIADPRLWPDGRLELRFASKGDRAAVARIEYRASGLAARATGAGTPRASTTPDARLDVLVLPIALPSRPAPAPELLRQAFGGDVGYRNTPDPARRPTAGSFARWIQQLSGGRTTVSADVRPPVELDVDPEADAVRMTAALEPYVARAATRPDVVAAVVSGPVPDQAHALRLGAIPVVVLGEREADGSYLALGTIARAVLSEVYGLESFEDPARGAFGDLALTATTDRHMPAMPAGPNLVRTGWADVVDVGPGDRTIRLTPLLEGRTVLRCTTPDVLGAPELWIETRPTPGATDPSEPAGVLAYRRFAPGHEPLIRTLDGDRTLPSTWRLSPRTGALRAPFVPGVAGDLFRDTFRLDDVGPPSLATPFGETPWTIDRVDIVAGGAAELRLHSTRVDLLDATAIGWLTGDEHGFGPLADDGVDHGRGSVRRIGRAFDLACGERPGATVRAVFADRGSRGARRLFGHVDAIEGGPCELRVRIDDREVAHFTGARDAATFVVDLPPLDPCTLSLDVVSASGRTRARLDRLVVVARSRGAMDVPWPTTATVDAATSDGVWRAGLHEFVLDERGHRNVRLPVLCPEGRGVLRLVASVAADDPRTATCNVRLRSVAGHTPVTVLDDFELPGAPSAPLRVALCELPGAERPDLTFLELEVRGAPRQRIHLVALEVDRL